MLDPTAAAEAAVALRLLTAAALRRLTVAVEEIAAMPVCRNAYRKQFCDLARRIKVIAPMFEEMSESAASLPAAVARALVPFAAALESARDLLRFVRDGSKISLVLDKDRVLKRFWDVTSEVEEAMNEISLDHLDISEELVDQVQLVRSQFKRAKERVDIPGAELYSDLSIMCSENTDASIDLKILKRLAEKLQLMTIPDLTQESVALHKLAVSSDDDHRERVGNMLLVLEKMRDLVQIQTPEMGSPANPETPAPEIPEEFCCPICLQLMKDPVIVATGKTYGRDCIEKWLEEGNDTCPATRQTLTNFTLTTNDLVRDLFLLWCQDNGMDPDTGTLPSRPPLACFAGEHSKIVDLISKLSSPNPDTQRSAAGWLRFLAKGSADNRRCIAEAGAIPHFVSLLSTTDPCTQEHAVAALLNLSIRQENTRIIVESNAVPAVVGVLRTVSMKTWDYAAAMLIFLSSDDEDKVTLGATGALEAIATLLSEGSQRVRKHAAQALFLLCLYKGNRAKAVRAGVVPILMGLLTEMEEALATLAILAADPEGRLAIGLPHTAMPALVEIIGNGTPKNRENAMGVLFHLFRKNDVDGLSFMAAAANCGIMPLIEVIKKNGTERGQRKAAALIVYMDDYFEELHSGGNREKRRP